MKTQYTADKPANTTKEGSPSAAPAKSSGKGLGLVALVVAMAAAGGTGYSYLKLEEIGSKLEVSNKRAAALEGLNAQLQDTTRALSTDVKNQTASLSRTMEAQLAKARESFSESMVTRNREMTSLVDIRTAELSESLQDTQMKLNRNQRSWLLSEVEYLLRTSVHRVMLAGDTDSAVEALKAAKSQLSVLAEVEYLPVSREIGAEITELRSADQPDIETLILDLRALSNKVNKLRMPAPEPAATEAQNTAESPPPSKESTGFGSMVSNLFRSIQDNVSIRSSEGTHFGTGDNNAIFAPSSEESTQAELVKLNLQAAQLAALRRDQSDYAAQLNRARENVKSLYDNQSATTADFIQELDLLTERTVVPYTDKLGGALRLLRETNTKLGAK